MSFSVVVNGVTYSALPTNSENGWGTVTSNWIQAISGATLQKSGGTFTLTADVDFGASFGLKTVYYKTQSANIASTGAVRLANADAVAWRNAANSSDLLLGVNSTNQLTFAGNPLTGSTALTGSRAVATASDGSLAASTVTSTELGYVSGVTSALQTQLGGKEPTITTLSKAKGGSGQDNSSLTFPASGTLATDPLTTKGDLIARSSTAPDRVAIGSDGAVLTADSAQTLGLKWATPASAPSSSWEISNIGLACSVASSALTIALKVADGSSDPSAGSPAKVGLRSSTATSGAYNQRSVSSALSLVISSGSTLGHKSAVNQYIYVYLIDSDGSGTMKLGASSSVFDDGTPQTTVAEGGAGGATSNQSLYSNAAYTSKPVRLIARLKSNQTTAGTWAAVPTEIALNPFVNQAVALSVGKSSAQTITTTAADFTGWDTPDVDTHNAFNVSTGVWTCPTPGIYTLACAGGAGSSGTFGIVLSLMVNGSIKSQGIIPPDGANSTVGTAPTICWRLAANDTVKLQIQVTTGSQGSNSTNAVNRLTIVKIGDL